MCLVYLTHEKQTPDRCLEHELVFHVEQKRCNALKKNTDTKESFPFLEKNKKRSRLN